MPKPMLLEAHEIITGDRATSYGDAKDGFTKIAEQWSLYLRHKYGINIILTPEDICWMMTDLKKIRQITKPKRDNVIDAAGYLGLIESLS